MRLIDENGKQLGIYPTREAYNVAMERGLDLVEVSPDARPPVCRLMDYGKFMYEQSRREREARRVQKQIEIKEIQLRPKTTDHHRDFKVKDAERWLKSGMKVRVTIRFRGREITYPEIAMEDLREIAGMLAEVSEIEQAPNMEGRTMFMMLAPKK